MFRTSQRLCIAATALMLAACANKGPAPSTSAPAPAASPSAPATAGTPSTSAGRIVKSRDGRFDGEIVGTPAANSKFARLQIGMTMKEVNSLIGTPNDLTRHETGKRWIPFYYGNDAQRMQALYQGEGCLTYTGGNVFGGGGNELIRISVDRSGNCWKN
jgi:hypothetical protein